ncbi:MAG: hypothetical protein LKM30_05365 [Bacilli bacterium]|jgi:hypothetical protein|nr:hypothetical protein [Bacilli bacterium]
MNPKALVCLLPLLLLSGCSKTPESTSVSVAPLPTSLGFYCPSDGSAYYEDTFLFNPGNAISYDFAFPLVSEKRITHVFTFHLNDSQGNPMLGYDNLTLAYVGQLGSLYYSYLTMTLDPALFPSLAVNVSSVSLSLYAEAPNRDGSNSTEIRSYQVSLPVSLTFTATTAYQFNPELCSCLQSFSSLGDNSYSYHMYKATASLADPLFVMPETITDKAVSAVNTTYQDGLSLDHSGTYLSSQLKSFQATVTRQQTSSLHGPGFYLRMEKADGIPYLVPPVSYQSSEVVYPFLSQVVLTGLFYGLDSSQLKYFGAED